MDLKFAYFFDQILGEILDQDEHTVSANAKNQKATCLRVDQDGEIKMD